MIDFIIIFVAQLIFQLLRTYSQRVVSKDHKVSTMITTFFVQIFWLITTGLGVLHFNSLNWIGITGYLIGGVLGSGISFYLPIFEKQKELK